jgi:hypothetical protein
VDHRISLPWPCNYFVVILFWIMCTVFTFTGITIVTALSIAHIVILLVLIIPAAIMKFIIPLKKKHIAWKILAHYMFGLTICPVLLLIYFVLVWITEIRTKVNKKIKKQFKLSPMVRWVLKNDVNEKDYELAVIFSIFPIGFLIFFSVAFA